MKLREDSDFPVPDQNLLKKFAEFAEVILPEDYKLFLSKYNGAIPITNVFWHKGADYVVERFLCLLENQRDYGIKGCYDVEVVMAQLDDRIADDEDSSGWPIIPIAALFGGDMVCLDFRESKNPSVVVWFHEESEELNPVTTKVADSFTEFLSILVEE